MGANRRIVYSTPIPMAVADPPSPGDADSGSPLARLDAADRRISRRMTADWPHPRWLSRPLGAFSLTANYGILWYAVALVPWLTGGRRPVATLVYVGVAVTAVEALGFVVKHFVGRHRPTVTDPSLPNHIPLPVSKSMPSSHASMAVTATPSVACTWACTISVTSSRVSSWVWCSAASTSGWSRRRSESAAASG